PAAQPAVGERPAGFHRDLPEQHFTQLVQQRLDVVGLADRYAARGDDHVGTGGRRSKGAFELIRHIGDDAHVDYIAIEPRQHSIERVAVAVVDLTETERRANRFELIP